MEGRSEPAELATRRLDKQGDATFFFKAMLNGYRPGARPNDDDDLDVAALLLPARTSAMKYLQNFDGMTEEAVSREELTIAREALVVSAVGDGHRQFLAGSERGEPDWSLLGIAPVAYLPAVKWRQQTLDRVDKDIREKLVRRLEEVLFGNEA